MLAYKDQGANIVIEFSAATLDHFVRNRQIKNSAAEAGGQLFATFNGGVTLVEKATGPRRGDRRSRFGFHPDQRAEQMEIKRMFKRGLHYVGDWHTHPTQIPYPSPQDLQSIRAAVRHSIHELKGFILVIVGNAPFPAGLSVTLDTGKEAYKLQVFVASTTIAL
jgi:integrative and conjugative element protein (TIGR02256 family)